MPQAILRPGSGERRGDTRFELTSWADVRRAGGEDAGKVLITDISRAGLNMQSRWDFSAREALTLDIAPISDCQARVAWHDPVVGSYGCRFDQRLSETDLNLILSFAAEAPGAPRPTLPWDERRNQPRFEIYVPVIARRNEAIEREVAVITNLSNAGFRMRTVQPYDLKQTVFVELGDNLLTEARIVRHNKPTAEYGGRFMFPLAPALIDRLISTYSVSTVELGDAQ